MAKSRRPKTHTLTTLHVVENHNEANFQAVAARAYQLYLERGCTHGHDLDDWIEAERQIRMEYGQTNAYEVGTVASS